MCKFWWERTRTIQCKITGTALQTWCCDQWKIAPNYKEGILSLRGSSYAPQFCLPFLASGLSFCPPNLTLSTSLFRSCWVPFQSPPFSASKWFFCPPKLTKSIILLRSYSDLVGSHFELRAEHPLLIDFYPTRISWFGKVPISELDRFDHKSMTSKSLMPTAPSCIDNGVFGMRDLDVMLLWFWSGYQVTVTRPVSQI